MVNPPNALPPKLAQPSVAGLAARERLFALLDRFRRRPITWIEGPPGAGKTSLVSSWIEARGLRCLWYQIDPGDADPATFFHYLRQAVPPGAAPLPPLTSEYLPDLAGFTRRFFKALAERMPNLAVIVLDNFQDASGDSPLATLVRDGVGELHEGVTLVVLSRTDPPAAFAESIAHADLARLGWEDLQLDIEETRRLAGVGADRAQTLRERTGGWAAGLRLVLEGRDGASVSADVAEAPEVVFEYLATEVFDRSPPELRELWLATAYLPRFTAEMAGALTARRDARTRLDELVSRRYFIERCAGADSTYQYHALFSEFLRRQVARQGSGAERRALAHRSAGLLAGAGETEAAIRLYCEAEDHQAAIPLILSSAPALLGQGRWQTLHESLTALPASLLEEVPWLLYWVGAVQAMTHPPRGRATLERSYARFVALGDQTGQAMSLAAILDTFFKEWDHLPAIDSWLDAARALHRQGLAFPSADTELRFWSSLVFNAAYREPASPLARDASRRVLELIDSEAGSNEKVSAGAGVLHFLTFIGEFGAARRVEEKLQPLVARGETVPLSRLSMAWGQQTLAHHAGDFARALELSVAAQRIIDDNGFVFARTVTREFEIWIRAEMGDFAAAARLLAELAPGMSSERPNEVALYHFLNAWLALARGEARRAFEAATTAIAASGVNTTIGPVICTHSILALAAASCGESARAQAAVAVARAAVVGLENGALGPLVSFVEAECLISAGDEPRARESLRRGLAAARASETVCCAIFLPDMMARLCAMALEAGIEPAVATHIIVTRRLEAPSPDIEAWPWPIRIRALGRFEVLVNGEILRHARKAQRRVLDLLKAIVALGAEGVSRDSIAAALWPESEGDAARDAFEVTLHRLRKLLGRDDVIQLSHGMLHLNSAVAWTDALAFERLAAKANGDQAAVRVEPAERAFALYGGPFLRNEEDAAWLLPARERLRSRFVRLACRLAQHYERAGDPGRAADLCASALEGEPLAEEIYRRLMAGLAAQGRRAEALDVYRRCRQMLSTVLGATPSRETEALHQAITKAA